MPQVSDDLPPGERPMYPSTGSEGSPWSPCRQHARSSGHRHSRSTPTSRFPPHYGRGALPGGNGADGRKA